MSTTRARVDVAVIGGGCCGLACAAALSARGVRVVVLERRGDPDSADGIDALARAAGLLERANALEARGAAGSTAARVLLAEARRIRDDYWGGQARNVILDSHSVAALEALGATTATLPRIERFALEGPPGGPTFAARLASRRIAGERDGLSAVRLLWQRDWTALAPLGAVERLLRDACERLSNVELRFGVTVDGIEARPDALALATTTAGGAGEIEAGFAVVADGGGRRSLLVALGVGRTVHHRERLSLAVRTAADGLSVLGADSMRVFSVNSLTDDGWLGLFGNGRAVSAVVNRTGMRSGEPHEAAQALWRAGLTTALVEPPVTVTAEIAEAQAHSVGRHVAIAGDAVLSGNPRIGLGVQFGLLWAQRLACSVAEVDGRLALDEARWEREARAICAERRDFELAWMEIVDRTIEQPARLAEYTVSEPVLAALVRFDVCAALKAPGRWRYQLRFTLDGAHIDRADDSAVAGFLRALGRADVDARVVFRVRVSRKGRLRLRARLHARRPITLEYGAERLLLDDGVLELRRRRAGWEVRLADVSVQQLSHGRFHTRFPLEATAIRLPDGYLDALLANAIERARSGTASARAVDGEGLPPWRMRAALAPGAEVRLGALRLQARGAVVVSSHVIGGRELTIRYGIEKGTLEPLNLLEFAQHSGLAAARWLPALARLTGGIAAPLIDGTARLAAAAVNGMEMRLRGDGSAVIRIDAGMPFSIALGPAEAARLQADLLAAPELAVAVGEQLGAVTAFDLALTRAD